MRDSWVPLLAAMLAGCAAHGGSAAGQGGFPGPMAADEQALAAQWKVRCGNGFAVDCRDLGRAHLVGAGVDHDDRTAAAYLLKACEIGEPASCSDLAVLTLLGRGVAQDDASGGALTRRACSAGYALACSNLGTLTIEGVNKLALRPDQEGEGGRQVLRSFEIACEAGALEGCLNLGTARERGALVARDPPGAAAAFQRACSGGLALGCHRLALLVRDDPKAAPGADATSLSSQACRAGIVPACAGLAESPGPIGPRTPTDRLVADRTSYALGIPGAGGFHPLDLTSRPGGPRRSRERLDRLPPGQFASVPVTLRDRLGLRGPAEAAGPDDEPVDLLLALRRPQLAACLERERSSPAAATLAAVFLLESSGRPTDLRAATEPADAGLEACAQEVIRGWTFPVPTGGGSGPHLVRFDFEAAPPGPAPGYASPSGLRPALMEPGCVERRLRVPEAYRGATNAVTVILAVDAAGRPALFHALTLAPEPVVAAIGEAVRACPFRAGVDDGGQPVTLWLTLTVKVDGR